MVKFLFHIETLQHLKIIILSPSGVFVSLCRHPSISSVDFLWQDCQNIHNTACLQLGMLVNIDCLSYNSVPKAEHNMVEIVWQVWGSVLMMDSYSDSKPLTGSSNSIKFSVKRSHLINHSDLPAKYNGCFHMSNCFNEGCFLPVQLISWN